MTFGLSLDFATQRKQGSPAWVGLCVVGALVAATMLWRMGQTNRELATVEQRLALTRNTVESQAVEAKPTKATEISPQRAAAVNQAVAQLNVPWETTLHAIETQLPAGVSLLRLEPYPAEHRLRITAQAQDADTLFGFVGKLADDPVFVSALPVRQEKAEVDGATSLRLTIELEWRL